NTTRCRHVFKRAVAAIAKQPAGGTVIRLRGAVGFLPPIDAAEYVMLGRPPDIVADKQIKQSIAVVIEPKRRSAEGGAAAETGFIGDIDERSAARIVEQPALADRGDIDIRKTVVIVIGDGDAEAVYFQRKAR